MISIDTYRITTDRWRRTWQAEWDGCRRAPRAWTERGARRKAMRRSGQRPCHFCGNPISACDCPI